MTGRKAYTKAIVIVAIITAALLLFCACTPTSANPATLKGDPGPAGSPGPTGATGPAGPAGPTGVRGPQGVQGPAGEDGEDGERGAKGATGAKGDTGPAGPKGATGATGPAGPKGATGATGPKGDKGDKGAKGDTGVQGPAGVAGAKGDKGDKGEKGDTGAQGPAGICTAYGMAYCYGAATVIAADAYIGFAYNSVMRGVAHTAADSDFTVPADGDYAVSYSVNYTAGADAKIAVTVDGTAQHAGSADLKPAEGNVGGDVLLHLAAGQKVALRNISSVPITLSGTCTGAQVSIMLLRET